MDSEEEILYEDEVELVSDNDEVEMVGSENEENDDGIDDGFGEIVIQPVRDDAKNIFSNHKGSVFCCDIQAKGENLIVTGGEDDKAYIWKPVSGEVVLQCTGHKDSVTCVGFSFDGTYVATGDMSGLVQVWKVAEKSLVWETNVEDLEWLKWHPGANVLLTGTITGDVYMWRIPAGECKILPGRGKKTDCGVILPDGIRAAIGYENGEVNIYDIKNAKILHNIHEGQAHSDSITDMDCHPDNNLLITGGTDGRAVVIKTQDGRIVAVLDPANDRMDDGSTSQVSMETVGFYKGSSSLPLAATGSLNGLLCIWDVSRGVERHRVRQDAGIIKLLWDKSNPIIYTASLDGSIGLYDARSGALEKQFLGHSNGILDIALSEGGEFLLSTSYDSTARIYSVKE